MNRTIGPQSGFSLVEVLMTVFVLAMVTSVMVVTLPKGTSLLMQEARRLEGVLELGAQQAKVTGAPLGLMLGERSYSLAVWRNQRWEVLAETEHHIRRDMQITNLMPASAEEDLEEWPALVFDPLAGVGEVLLEMRHARDRVSIIMGVDGKIEVEQRRG